MNSVAGWSNLSALGCLIALVLWFATTGLPNIMDKWEKESSATRADFKEVVDGLVLETKEQRKDFREELREQRKESHELAVSGHDAVNALSKQIYDLHETVKKNAPVGAID